MTVWNAYVWEVYNAYFWDYVTSFGDFMSIVLGSSSDAGPVF